MNESGKWIVLWINNNRIGSVELNQSNWNRINEQFHYSLIQTDSTGTVHLECLGIKHTNKRNKARKANTNKPIEKEN